MKRIAGGFLFLLLTSTVALSEPPQITWEWYSAAEAYQGSKNRRPDDLRLSVHYFRLAADKGNTTAAFKLGELYEAGEGVARDPFLAFYWYMKSAARNNKHGQLKIGWCYQKGIGVQPDPRIAAIWYRLAADNDNIWGYHMLAFMLADGEGVTKDVALARRYLELSLPKTKDHWAKWKLAHLIAQDDPKKARALLREAAAAGNAQAEEDLKKLP